MSKRFFAAAFAIGLLAVAWVGQGFVGTNWLALAMTVAIGCVYVLGAWELRQFRADTASLSTALQETASQAPAALPAWLDRLPLSLRPAVRQRLEGERGALPGPALTPYLVGLLVMLGMLGTFLGMVVTFKGAMFAMQGSTDLQAIRAALAEPIRGLGLSFGTSIAGVAASAMLGLMSAIARRERLDAARTLDQRIAGTLRPFSFAHQREETFRALQAQAGTLPQVVDKLEALMQRLDQRAQQLDAQLLAGQSRFHQEAAQSYGELARTVGASLQDSLVAAATAAGDSIRPVVASAMQTVVEQSTRENARVAEAMQQHNAKLAEAAQQQVQAVTEAAKRQADALTASAKQQTESLTASAKQQTEALTASVKQQAEALATSVKQQADTLTASFRDTARTVETGWQSALQAHARSSDAAAAALRESLADFTATFEQRSSALVSTLGDSFSASHQGQATRERERLQAWTESLEALGSRLEAQWQRLAQDTVQQMATLGGAMEAPVQRLLQTASEVPAAAAGVLSQLREEVGRSAERDNLALQERTTLLEKLGTVLHEVQQAAGAQRDAIATLVQSTTTVLEQSSTQFAQVLEANAGRATDTAAHIAASSIEMSTLAQAFAEGVQHFQASNGKVLDTLVQLESTLQRSIERSDEQLAYYVTQAREVIDLSITSQEGILGQLRQLQGKQAIVTLADEALG
ncbi:DUF802 domain-containing protein [Ramlibacter sp. MMS24-I3-19]|uniref:DUF802 domain-containing protein n=1 Tax=Ramlibacter sp. MMS24-I3-19 TaxID=3416606 RepID=UPI003D047DF5